MLLLLNAQLEAINAKITEAMNAVTMAGNYTMIASMDVTKKLANVRNCVNLVAQHIVKKHVIPVVLKAIIIQMAQFILLNVATMTVRQKITK